MRRSAITILLALLPWTGVAADPVANEVCLTCHASATTGNPDAPHFKTPVRCESCHGEGARHAESGDPKLIRSFKGKPAAEVCTTCHKNQHVAEWKASRHHEVGVDCADCHAMHTQKDPKASCRGCHSVQTVSGLGFTVYQTSILSAPTSPLRFPAIRVVLGKQRPSEGPKNESR